MTLLDTIKAVRLQIAAATAVWVLWIVAFFFEFRIRMFLVSLLLDPEMVSALLPVVLLFVLLIVFGLAGKTAVQKLRKGIFDGAVAGAITAGLSFLIPSLVTFLLVLAIGGYSTGAFVVVQSAETLDFAADWIIFSSTIAASGVAIYGGTVLFAIIGFVVGGVAGSLGKKALK